MLPSEELYQATMLDKIRESAIAKRAFASELKERNLDNMDIIDQSVRIVAL